MNRIGTFFKLPWPQKRLFAAVLLLVWRVRIKLWLVSFEKIQRWIFEPTPVSARKSFSPVSDLVRLVSGASRLVPRATCLTQAIAAKKLLAAHGYASQVRIGVLKKEEFQAHAWLEVDGKTVIGATQKSYQRLV